MAKKKQGPLVDLNDPTNKDTIPAMLTKGEYVLNKEATALFGPAIEKMNQIGLEQRKAENKAHLNMGGYPVGGSYTYKGAGAWNQGGHVSSSDLGLNVGGVGGFNQGGPAWWSPSNWAPGLVDKAPAVGDALKDPSLLPRTLDTIQNIPGLLASNNLPSGDVNTTDDIIEGNDTWSPPAQGETYEQRLINDAAASRQDIHGAGHDRFKSTITGEDYRIVPGKADKGANPQFNKLVDSEGYRAPHKAVVEYRREAAKGPLATQLNDAKVEEAALQDEAKKELQETGTLSNATKNALEDAKGKTIVAESNVAADKTAEKGEKLLGEQYAVDAYEEYKTNASKAGLEDVMPFEEFKKERIEPEIKEDVPPLPKARPEEIISEKENITLPKLKSQFSPEEQAQFDEAIKESQATGPQLGAVWDQAKSIFGDLFGDISKKDIGRFMMLYLGGRLTGGSHEGSLRVAGTNALKYHDARLKAEADAAAKQGYKRKSGTKTLETPDGKEYKFFEYEGPGGVSWRTHYTDKSGKSHLLSEEELTQKGIDFQKEGTATSKSKLWNTTTKAWGGEFDTIFDDVNPREGFEGDKYNLITGAEASSDTREYFKDQGYSIDNPEHLAAMQVIANRGARAAADYAANNPKKKVGSIRPFLQRETLFAKTGVSDVWISQGSDDANKIKYTNPKKIAKLDDTMKSIITSENPGLDPVSLNATAKDQWNRLVLAWEGMSDKHKGNNYSPSKDESAFYVFALKVLEDSKITEDELKEK